MARVSSWGWRRWLEANLGRRPTTSRGGPGGVGQEERWRPQEDANESNGKAVWAVACKYGTIICSIFRLSITL